MYCLSFFDSRLMITFLVSSNLSYVPSKEWVKYLVFFAHQTNEPFGRSFFYASENYLLYLRYPLGEHLRNIKINNKKLCAFPTKRIKVYHVVPKKKNHLWLCKNPFLNVTYRSIRKFSIQSYKSKDFLLYVLSSLNNTYTIIKGKIVVHLTRNN